jgi:hypothetical protein
VQHRVGPTTRSQNIKEEKLDFVFAHVRISLHNESIWHFGWIILILWSFIQNTRGKYPNPSKMDMLTFRVRETTPIISPRESLLFFLSEGNN